MKFEQALQALKDGKMAERTSWAGSRFVFMQVPAIIPKDVVPKMQSLPQSVKDEFKRRFDDPLEQINAIYYCDQLAIVGRSNQISGWSPSVEDAFAADWIIKP